MDNLPIQLTSFIGREQELAEVRQLLTKNRLVTLTGPGGCGKTRLALQAASVPVYPFADGTWWVDLSSTTDPALVPQVVLTALASLGLREEPGLSPLAILGSQLGSKQMLFMLDNCEHLSAACAQLAHLILHTCPNIHILATSRESLGVSGERVWLVPSLTTPPQPVVGAPRLSLDEVLQYEAVRLFVDRAQALNRTFRLGEQNAEAVAQICRRFDGIPLAIELAAARTTVLSAEQIAVRLEDSFWLLGVAARTLLPRHRTLRAAIDWSYGLLSAIEQALLRRLSVFSGGFVIEAVEAICAGAAELGSSLEPAFDPGQVLDLLAGLVGKSLVVVYEQEGVARYRLLETIRQYGHEKLDSDGESTAMRTCHLNWYLCLAEEADAKTKGPDAAASWVQLETEHDNLRAALAWALMDNADLTRVDRGIRLVFAVFGFWYIRGYAREGRFWLDRVLNRSDSSDTALRAKLATYAGVLAWCQNDYAQASLLLQEGQALARSLGAEGKPVLQFAVNYLGFIAFYQDDYARATTLFEEWLVLVRELGHHWRVPFVLSLLGRVAVRIGEYARATLLAEESLVLSKQLEIAHSISATLNLLGTVACYNGTLGRATALLAESLAISRTLSYQQDIADTLVMLAIVAIHQENFQSAKEALEESLAVSRQTGYRQGIALSLARLGEVACGQGDYAGAAVLLHESLALFDVLDARWHTLHCLESIAVLTVVPGPRRLHAWQAVQLLAAAHTLRVTLGGARPPIDQPRYERTLAALRSTLGDLAFAAAWAEGTAMELEQAIACAQQSQYIDNAQLEIPGKQQSAVALLRICALGAAQVYCSGTLLTAAAWTYAIPKELLFYLLCHPPRTREQIGIVFWPDASPTQLRTRLHDTLHRLRQALGRPDWVLYTDEHYTFNRTLDYWFDVEVFESQIKLLLHERGTSPGAAALQQLEETLLLYQGDFLEEIGSKNWVVQPREVLRSLYLEGLLMLGERRFALEEYEAAAAAYRQAIAHDTYLETAHRELMRCLARHGATHQALRHYRTLVELLREELGVLPAPETTALFETLRRGHAV